VRYVPAETMSLCTSEDGAITVFIDKNGVTKTDVFTK